MTLELGRLPLLALLLIAAAGFSTAPMRLDSTVIDSTARLRTLGC